jgi:hypothetical protein
VEVVYKPRAAKVIIRVADWIDSQNQPGSGKKWFYKLDERLTRLAKSKAKFAICKHPSLAKFKYRCFPFHDWIIAFRISGDRFEVCRFIWGARLS